MKILTRQQVIEQLQNASAVSDGTQGVPQLASWAFDQFYAEEAGTIAFEAGYRGAIGAVLDDLMFADQPGFFLSTADLRQMVVHLEQVEPANDLDDEEDTDELELED